jgi:NAD(P)-dependent dehydrogenase (short-subunit alcohol dehydrogenase family)
MRMQTIQELFSLKDRVAIVTGASRGLGKEAAEGLAEAGAKVVITGRREQWLTPTTEEFKSRGFDCLAVKSDVAVEGQAEEVVAKVMAHYGRIDILVNNAGISWGAPYEEMPIDAWHKVLNTNVIGTHMMTRAVLPQMRAQGYGKIINVASVVALVGPTKDVLEAASYTASKGAIVALTREVAVQYASQGIRVNALAPGYFPTRLSSGVIERSVEFIIRDTPLGRLGAPGELKGAILFLSSPASDYITGQVLAVDGGMSAR